MKRALWLMCCSLGLGCSAGAADDAGGGGKPSTALGGSAGAASAAGGGAGGMSAGTAGQGGSGGSPATGGTLGATGGGGANTGGAPTAGAGGSGGMPAGGGGAGGAASCVPNPSGSFSIVGDTVHDAKTCLDWMKTTKTSVNYAAAEMFCGDSMLGGFDDWRIPTVSEFASIVTLCGKYAPEGPVDPQFFDEQGDGYWTRTPAGELNKVCAIGMANAGGYYHYGTAGPQVVRCVRGSGSVKMVADCTTAMGCKDW
jgi:hypothetical protein